MSKNNLTYFNRDTKDNVKRWCITWESLCSENKLFDLLFSHHETRMSGFPLISKDVFFHVCKVQLNCSVLQSSQTFVYNFELINFTRQIHESLCGYLAQLKKRSHCAVKFEGRVKEHNYQLAVNKGPYQRQNIEENYLHSSCIVKTWEKKSGSVISSHYRPQRSWGKVMFSQASVILLTGAVSASVHAGIHPLGADTPWEKTHPPGSRHPLELIPPSPRTACWEIWSTRGRYASYWNAILLWVFSVVPHDTFRDERCSWTLGYEVSFKFPPDQVVIRQS